MSKKILCANGCNLDLLGTREPAVYGHTTLADIETMLRAELKEHEKRFGQSFDLECFQSNDEGAFLNHLHLGYDGIIINPGAWTHTSLALADRLVGIAVPYVEIHISNVYQRESFRHHSYISKHASGIVTGFGAETGYCLALRGLLQHIC